MKTVFITNRGGTHPNRLFYFDSINADYQYVDFRLRWHGRKSSWVRMILSGVLCALSFPNRKKYELFVTSDPQLPAILMKVFGLLRKDQKVVSYLGSQTLYFIHSNYYSRWTILFYKFLLRRYDAHICNGNMQADLLKRIIQVDQKIFFVNFNGISAEREKVLSEVTYRGSGLSLLFIGNLYSSWRLHYKGVDLLLGAFNQLKKRNPDLSLTIVGEADSSLHDLIRKMVDQNYVETVRVVGKTDSIQSYLSEAILYVHPSRGDALPNSLTEALSAGIPSVVSNFTGGADMVASIDQKLICQLDREDLVNSIQYFLDLPESVKRDYSLRARVLTKNLTAGEALARFKTIIKQIATL